MVGIELLGAGGAMTLLGFVVKALVDHIRRQHTVISNHMQHSTAAMTAMAAAVHELAVALDRQEHK